MIRERADLTAIKGTLSPYSMDDSVISAGEQIVPFNIAQPLLNVLVAPAGERCA